MLDEIDGDMWDAYGTSGSDCRWAAESAMSMDYCFHDRIFALCVDSATSTTRPFHGTLIPVMEHRRRVVTITPTAAGVGGKGEITVEWGGKEGPAVSGSISGHATDRAGNTAEMKVEIRDDRTGKATLSAERKSHPNS